MSTERQIDANRLNAQHSTGPITPEGRAAVRLNGLKYGLYAETLILPGEDPAQFDALLDRLDAEYQPATPTEEQYVSQLAMACWRRARVQRMEAGYYQSEHKHLSAELQVWYLGLDDNGRLAYIAARDLSLGPKSVLAGFHRYEARMDRSIKNAEQSLRRCREDRCAERPAQDKDQTQSAPVERPKDPPSAKIINIEAVERPQSPLIPAPEPPPSDPPAADPAPSTDK
jgi:hypothetical protein